MRVFVAIDLSEDVRGALAKVQRELRTVAREARWVSPQSIHITLKFIGEATAARVAEIEGALSGLKWKAFEISVRGVGFFPGIVSPRVLWAGMEAPALAGLVGKIESRLEKIGFEREKRTFRPHITLVRARESRMASEIVKASMKYQNHLFGSFVVDRFFLYQSRLGSEGAVYNKLREYFLER